MQMSYDKSWSERLEYALKDYRIRKNVRSWILEYREVNKAMQTIHDLSYDEADYLFGLLNRNEVTARIYHEEM